MSRTPKFAVGDKVKVGSDTAEIQQISTTGHAALVARQDPYYLEWVSVDRLKKAR